MAFECWVGWWDHPMVCEWVHVTQDSPRPSLRPSRTQTGLFSHPSLTWSKGCHVCNMSLHPDAPVYWKITESCSNFQRFMILWKESDQQPKDLCVCFRFVPHSYVRCQTLLGCRFPSIIRKCIFSFSNLWLLFPFTDGVTNYFIIGFLKTSYLLFGSISKMLTWLSLILMVGLPGEEPNGGS